MPNRPLPEPAFRPIQQLASPADGATITLLPDSRDVTLWLTPAAAIAALTVVLPLDGNTKLQQNVTVKSSQAITALTFQGQGGDAGSTTIYGNGAALVVGGARVLQKQASKTWA